MERLDPSKQDISSERTLYQWLILVGAVVALLALAGFGGVWGYRHVKVWRAHELTHEAKDLLDHNKTAEGEAKLMAAHMLEPYDVEVLRALAAHELSLRNRYAMYFYNILAAQPGATRDDQREALRAYLSFGDLQSAEALAKILIAKAPEAEDYALQGQVDWRAGEQTQAISSMRQALALDPKSRANQFLLGQTMSLLPGDESQAEAIKMLRELAQTQDAEGLKALEALAVDTRLDAASQGWTLEQLRKHPLLDDEGRFDAWALEKRMGVWDVRAIMREVVHFFQSSDLARKAIAARWLFDQGQPESALELATLSDARTNQELLLVRLDALASLNDWAEMEDNLPDNAPLPQALLFLYRAGAAHELGDSAGSAENWDRARAAAATDKRMLPVLGEDAVKMGLYDEAKKTYTLMAHIPELTLEAYTALLKVEAQHGTNAEIIETLNQMMANLPKQSKSKDDVGAMMREVVEFFRSSDPTRKAIAARWLFDQGQPESALELATLSDAQANQELLLVRLDALAFSKNWAEVEKELPDNAPLSQALLFLYRARAARELGDPARSAENCDRARVAAATEKGTLYYLGQNAVKMGLYDEAKKTYTQMAHIPEQAMEGYTALLQVEAQHGTNAEIQESLSQMMADVPMQPKPKNAWACLNLLLNTNVEDDLPDNAPLPQTLIFLYRAHAAQELGDPAGSGENWDHARSAAATEKGMLPVLGEYAVKLGLYDEAKKTYTQMAHIPEQAMEGYNALLKMEAQHGTNAESLETLKQMMGDLPMQPEPKNNWAYLSLLLNTNVNEAWNTAQSLVQINPQSLAYRTTLALGYLRKNDTVGAEKVYEGVQTDWSTALPSEKLVYAVVLGANGKKDQAAALVQTLDRSQLRPEELALVDFYLPGTKGVSSK